MHVPCNLNCKNNTILQYNNVFFLFLGGVSGGVFVFSFQRKFVLRKVFHRVVENVILSHEFSGKIEGNSS